MTNRKSDKSWIDAQLRYEEKKKKNRERQKKYRREKKSIGKHRREYRITDEEKKILDQTLETFRNTNKK